jgi:YD repeat-containing protein
MTSSNIAGTVTTYTYDTLGNLVLEKAKNKVVDYQYNELNQLIKKKEGNESYSYTYDKRGNRTAEIGKKASRHASVTAKVNSAVQAVSPFTFAVQVPMPTGPRRFASVHSSSSTSPGITV